MTDDEKQAERLKERTAIIRYLRKETWPTTPAEIGSLLHRINRGKHREFGDLDE